MDRIRSLDASCPPTPEEVAVAPHASVLGPEPQDLAPRTSAAFGRRTLLKAGAAAGVGLGLGAAGSLRAEQPAAEPGIASYRKLGRTGLEISDISFGSSRLADGEDVVRYALDHGINYFDTAESYKGGRAEENLGRALRGVRERVILASKLKCEEDSTRAELMSTLEGSLRRLQTDRIEIFFNHAVNDVDRLKNPEWGEFVERAKEQGKIRFTGISGHGGLLSECIRYALDQKLVDVMLLAYNFGQDPSFYERLTRSFDFIAIQPELPSLLARAKREGVGTIAMKTLMGAKLNDMRPFEGDGGSFAQAAFRWVLSNSDIDALIVSMTSTDQIREYLGASGQKSVRSYDVALLETYIGRHTASQCRQGCSLCEGACPAGVAIADALRTRMYAVDYGDLELGRREYRLLGEPAAACSGCSHSACAGSCPFGLRVSDLVRDAHRRLSSA